MNEKKNFTDEVFERRIAFYKENKRNKLPWQSTQDSCARVSDSIKRTLPKLSFPEDFLASPEDPVDGHRLPIDLFCSGLEYDALTNSIKLTGSGGAVLLDKTHCAIDVTRYLLTFIQPESCGECTLCRIGINRLLSTVTRICNGEGKSKDIDDLEELAGSMEVACICEVGKMASRPVLSTLRYFKEDYIAHIEHHNCRAGKCAFSKGNNKETEG